MFASLIKHRLVGVNAYDSSTREKILPSTASVTKPGAKLSLTIHRHASALIILAKINEIFKSAEFEA
jgi:hypothetical protein